VSLDPVPLFSVIVPVFNRAALLRDTLESILRQRLTDYEIIVVDDGSNDGSTAVARAFRDKVRVLEQANLGPGAARNLGCQHALGRYVAFLDSDDLWFPWTLEVYAQVIRQANEPAFIAGKPKRFSDPAALDSIAREQLVVSEFVDYYASGDEWRWWGVSSFVIRRDALQSVGGFTSDWVNGEDADLAMKLGVAKGFAQVTAPATFAYREHAGCATGNLSRTVRGVMLSLASEKGGEYPGGVARGHERRRILTRHVRPATLDCLRQGMRREAWQLYSETFGWHLQLGRWKYLLGFPVKVAVTRS
jgi:GT2 family glycosyltransferase